MCKLYYIKQNKVKPWRQSIWDVLDGTAGVAVVAGVAAATGAGVADATVTGADITSQLLNLITMN
jgi:hypothetical protein